MKNNLVVHKPQLRLLQESLNRGDFEVVINEAENLLSNFAKDFRVWNILGSAHAQLGNLAKSVDAFAVAVDLNPLFSDGYNNLGNVQKLQQKLSVAEQSYRKAIEISLFFSALNNQAFCCKNSKNYGRCGVLSACHSNQPDFFEAHNALGIACYDWGIRAVRESYRSAIFLSQTLKCITTGSAPQAMESRGG